MFFLYSFCYCSDLNHVILSHSFTVADGHNESWNRDPWMYSNHINFIFFVSIDPRVTIILETCSSTAGLAVPKYEVEWILPAKNVSKQYMLYDKVYRINMTGKGDIVFSEFENTDDQCNGRIYSINHPDIIVTLTPTYAYPDIFPKLNYGEIFCLFFASKRYEAKIYPKFGATDVLKYVNGPSNNQNVTGPITLSSEGNYWSNTKISNLMLKIEINSYDIPQDLTIIFKGEYSPPPTDLYPPLYLPTVSETDTPTISQTLSETPARSENHNESDDIDENPTPSQSRKINMIPDNPNMTYTTEDEAAYEQNYNPYVKKNTPLSGEEIATIATSASISIIMLIVAILLMLSYMRSKAKQMKEHDLNAEENDLQDTECDSTSYSYSYYYYYTSNESVEYSSESQEKIKPKPNKRDFIQSMTSRPIPNGTLTAINLTNCDTV